MSKYSRTADVIATDLGQELILLDPRNGEMFGLNLAGRHVWLALADRSADDLTDLVTTAFDVERDRARADVTSLLSALEQSGLVERYDGR